MQTDVPYNIRNATKDDAVRFREIEIIEDAIKKYENSADIKRFSFNDADVERIRKDAKKIVQLHPALEPGAFDSIIENTESPPTGDMWGSDEAKVIIRELWADIDKKTKLGDKTVKKDVEAALYYAYNLEVVRGHGEKRIGQVKAEVKGKGKMFCATYVALNPNSTSSLDALLQLVGRTFADLRDDSVPDGYAIKLLGGHLARETLQAYSTMEHTLVDARLKDESGIDLHPTLFDVLRQAIGPGVITGESGDVDIGTVGVRHVNFLEIFGYSLSEVMVLRNLYNARKSRGERLSLKQLHVAREVAERVAAEQAANESAAPAAPAAAMEEERA